MILKNKKKQAGLSMLELMIFMGVLMTVFFSLATATFKLSKVDEKETQATIARHEVLQPVVTELKNYKGLESNNGVTTKLSPVTSPEMRKEPIKPVAPEPVVTPAPIIEQNENHYHFEDLNSGITYLASIILVIFLLFCSFKGLGKLSKNLSVRKAIKRSEKIIESFEADINNSNTYLEYSKKITDQLSFNRMVIEQNKNSYHMPDLTVVNEKLIANLTFTERSLVTDMSKPI